jgi:chromate reductase
MEFDTQKLNILALPASLRAASVTRALLQALPELAPAKMEISVFDLHDIPLYNQDIEDGIGFPVGVQALRQAISEADGMIIATSEYNGSVPGVLKNSIDWASRQKLLAKRPVAPISASPGALGATKAQEHLRSILGHLGMYVLPRPALAIPKVRQKLENNRVTDEQTRQFIARWLESFEQWIRQLNK